MNCSNCGASTREQALVCEYCGAAMSSSAAVSSNQGVAEQFRQMAEQAQPGLVREFWEFLRDNKKWWITPIVLVLLLVGLLVITTGGTAAAPFIYTLF